MPTKWFKRVLNGGSTASNTASQTTQNPQQTANNEGATNVKPGHHKTIAEKRQNKKLTTKYANLTAAAVISKKSRKWNVKKFPFLDTRNEHLVEFVKEPVLLDSMISCNKLEAYVMHRFKTLDEFESQYLAGFEKLAGLNAERALIAHHEKHEPLNRYPDVYPSDDGIVQISKSEQNPTGYVNASYIFKNHPNLTQYQFIACQGPMDETIEDFYTMIWEKSIPWIVMLTNYEEQGEKKCAHYFPSKGSLKLKSGICIKIKDVKIEPTNKLTTFELSHPLTHQTRIVKQIHYTTWPDKSNPSYADMQEMLKFFISSVPTGVPVLVHCSAGVGRTGLFILCVVNWFDLKPKGIFNIDGVIHAMRETRSCMVQVPVQYMFAHLFLCHTWKSEEQLKKTLFAKL